MSFSFHKRRFENSVSLPIFVIVDPIRDSLGPANIRMHRTAGVLARCREALAHARRTGMPVAFMRSSDTALASSSTRSIWINGFEPARPETILERTGPSCYSGPYFEEIVEQGGGELVIAGLLGCGGGLSTAADALYAGHSVTFLRDAIVDEASERAFPEDSLQLLNAFTRFNVQVIPTHTWIDRSRAQLNGVGELRRAT